MHYDVIVIGAGAAGLMAAATAAKLGQKTLLLEKSEKIGEKIRISGGGRCNFTNINASSQNYISNNPHFVKSPLAQYTQHDFIKLVESYNISYHEKKLGQLFCDFSSNQIIEMLVSECKKYGVEIVLNVNIATVRKLDLFCVDAYKAKKLIIATGGLSIPKTGATDFGYKIAKQFGHDVIKTRPGLVPLTVGAEQLEEFKFLAGVSIDSKVTFGNTSFRENILFTHRGLSGPAILQISSYIKEIDSIFQVNLLPDIDLKESFATYKNTKITLTNFLRQYLPNRYVEQYFETKKLVDFKLSKLMEIAEDINNFKVVINGNEGYNKAEVTIGGVNTEELSSKTMESKKVSGLYFIGEVVDVTGWLAGYNFQWAWSSGFVAGSACARR
jgi:predicted Rossmann fold flavoprotein